MLQHFSDTIRNIRRSPYQSIAAVLTLTQTFFLAYLFVVMMIGSEFILRYFETQPQISAFFKPSVTDEEVATFQKQLEQSDLVKSVKRITKQDALNSYSESNKDDPLLLQLVSADILPASLEVSTKEIQFLPEIEQTLKELPGIDEVVFQKDVTNTLASWTKNLRTSGVILLTIMGITSVIQITVIMSMKVAAKRHAIRTMQLLGASRWYIHTPMLLEGALYGLLGTFLGWLAMYTTVLYLTPWLLNFLGDIPLLPVSPMFMVTLLGAGALVGVVLGSFSSLLASRRFLD